eukprot:scaffold307_cov162-Amphora_coffeaeformis.AAC.19
MGVSRDSIIRHARNRFLLLCYPSQNPAPFMVVRDHLQDAKKGQQQHHSCRCSKKTPSPRPRLNNRPTPLFGANREQNFSTHTSERDKVGVVHATTTEDRAGRYQPIVGKRKKSHGTLPLPSFVFRLDKRSVSIVLDNWHCCKNAWELTQLAMITRNLLLLCLSCLAVADAFVSHRSSSFPQPFGSRLFGTDPRVEDRVSTANKPANGKVEPTNGASSSDGNFDVFEIPIMLSRLATDVVRKVRWGDRVSPADSASMYMNPATQRLATNLTVSWEPDVADMLKALARLKGKPLLVGVVGIPGSGKSTSCEILASYLGDRSIVMPMDGYHLSLDQLAQLPDPADVIYRRGAPDTFDPASLIRDLERIKKSKEPVVKMPGFCHAVGDPQPDQHSFVRDDYDIVIVEGIYLMHGADGWERVHDLLDFCIYIEADVDICIDRLKIRNQCIPGYTAEEIEVRCEAVDRVNAETVLKSSRLASLTVPSSAMQSPGTKRTDECEIMVVDEVVTEEEVEQYLETVKEEAEAIIQDL